MPTVITHSVVGFIAGKILPLKQLPRRFWLLSIILPALPDADIIAFYFGIPYERFLGHRGFFHSLTFALILALAAVVVFFWKERKHFRRWIALLDYFFIITASHGILDAMTGGGLGIALLAPFDNTRYFFPFRPIEVSPIGIRAFFSQWGLRVLFSEIIWIWLPAIVIMFITRRIYNRRSI